MPIRSKIQILECNVRPENPLKFIYDELGAALIKQNDAAVGDLVKPPQNVMSLETIIIASAENASFAELQESSADISVGIDVVASMSANDVCPAPTGDKQADQIELTSAQHIATETAVDAEIAELPNQTVTIETYDDLEPIADESTMQDEDGGALDNQTVTIDSTSIDYDSLLEEYNGVIAGTKRLIRSLGSPKTSVMKVTCVLDFAEDEIVIDESESLSTIPEEDDEYGGDDTITNVDVIDGSSSTLVFECDTSHNEEMSVSHTIDMTNDGDVVRLTENMFELSINDSGGIFEESQEHLESSLDATFQTANATVQSMADEQQLQSDANDDSAVAEGNAIELNQIVSDVLPEKAEEALDGFETLAESSFSTSDALESILGDDASVDLSTTADSDNLVPENVEKLIFMNDTVIVTENTCVEPSDANMLENTSTIRLPCIVISAASDSDEPVDDQSTQTTITLETAEEPVESSASESEKTTNVDSTSIGVPSSASAFDVQPALEASQSTFDIGIESKVTGDNDDVENDGSQSPALTIVATGDNTNLVATGDNTNPVTSTKSLPTKRTIVNIFTDDEPNNRNARTSTPVKLTARDLFDPELEFLMNKSTDSSLDIAPKYDVVQE